MFAARFAGSQILNSKGFERTNLQIADSPHRPLRGMGDDIDHRELGRHCESRRSRVISEQQNS